MKELAMLFSVITDNSRMMLHNDTILLGHGSGGKLSHDLIGDLFVRHFHNIHLEKQTDSSILNIESGKIAFTTDSFVVDPIFFPGGDIGKLAVCGTVNDLAVSGARPLYLSAGFIIEEGFLYTDLEKIVVSMADEARKAGVMIVTGDTKVVDRGKCDKVFINTSGIGILSERYSHISDGSKIRPGDKVIINGPVGEHGMAVLSARKDLNIKSSIVSDCASLNRMIAGVLEATDGVRFMRDATRGGLATVLAELAEKNQLGISIEEEKLPVTSQVRSFCELLGFDPLYVANEGKVVIISSKESADQVILSLKKSEYGKGAEIIGEICGDYPGKAYLNTIVGGRRIIDMLAGEQLPRIC